MSVPTTYVTVASGFAVSSSFALSRADHALAVEVPSGVAGGAGLQFTTSSGGTTWLTLSRLDGSGLAWAACSGAVGGCGAAVVFAPTPWGRGSLAAATTTGPMSFAIYELTR